LYFAAQSPRSGSFWVPLLEKGFAKINRNYEGTNYGWMAESMRAFTGAPSV
jgi:Calpain family cysteine protease